MDGHIQLEIMASHLFSQVTCGIGLINGRLQGLDLGGIFTADIDIGIMTTDGVAADDNPLNHHMGITDQDVAVFEGGRFRLIGVDGQVNRFIEPLGEK